MLELLMTMARSRTRRVEIAVAFDTPRAKVPGHRFEARRTRQHRLGAGSLEHHVGVKEGGIMHGFLRALEEQRWDDHRYYHHSRINQSLHMVSAISFICMYALLFTKPAAAALIGWLVAMVSRQCGHFFFEPKGYDEINQASNDYKEEIKVGYNLRRKFILLSIWALTPGLLYIDPSFFGIFQPHTSPAEFVQHMGHLWVALGIGALLFRTIQLFFVRDVMTGIVWFTKILSDPFHDLKLYYKAPFQVLKGELFDPMAPTTEA
jgi:hypothetical protein